jgi:hypothetical protein
MRATKRNKLLEYKWKPFRLGCPVCQTRKEIYCKVNDFIEDENGDLQMILLAYPVEQVWAECPTCSQIVLFAP